MGRQNGVKSRFPLITPLIVPMWFLPYVAWSEYINRGQIIRPEKYTTHCGNLSILTGIISQINYASISLADFLKQSLVKSGEKFRIKLQKVLVRSVLAKIRLYINVIMMHQSPVQFWNRFDSELQMVHVRSCNYYSHSLFDPTIWSFRCINTLFWHFECESKICLGWSHDLVLCTPQTHPNKKNPELWDRISWERVQFNRSEDSEVHFCMHNWLNKINCKIPASIHQLMYNLRMGKNYIFEWALFFKRRALSQS